MGTMEYPTFRYDTVEVENGLKRFENTRKLYFMPILSNFPLQSEDSITQNCAANSVHLAWLKFSS